MRRTLQNACLLAGTAVLASSCAATHTERHLVITEVGTQQIELYLNEPPNEILRLGQGMVLTVTTTSGTSSELDFGTYDHTLPGSTFLMIWEEAGYNGPPVRQDFPRGQTGHVPGLKVRQGFFNDLDSSPAEVRLKGQHVRTTSGIAPFSRRTVENVRDVVRFGTPHADRPATGGTFHAKGTLGAPTAAVSLHRLWSVGVPLDRNDEDDWKHSPTSWGAPTP